MFFIGSHPAGQRLRALGGSSIGWPRRWLQYKVQEVSVRGSLGHRGWGSNMHAQGPLHRYWRRCYNILPLLWGGTRLSGRVRIEIEGVALMQVGVGLPTGLPGTGGELVIEWARRADEGPFSSLGVIDRLVYDSYDPLLSLAAAAAITHRVKLATTIVVGLMHNTAVLAKLAASLDALSGGRLVLGLAVG